VRSLPAHAAGSLAICACAAGWGSIALIVRDVDLPAMTIVFFRVALTAAVVAGGLGLARGHAALAPVKPVVPALGVLLAAHWSCYFAALQSTSVASAALITYASTVFVALLAPVLLHERVPASSLLALVIAVAGIALISLSGGSGEEEVRLGGVALALGAAVTMALLIILIKRFAADVEPIRFVVWESTAATLVLLPALVVPSFAITGHDVALLLLLGVVLGGVTAVMYITALHKVPATTAGILAYVEPLTAAVLAALFLDERITPAVLIGGAAILAASAIVILRGAREPATAGQPAPQAGS
jgi:DME family drug/metabolite transporter